MTIAYGIATAISVLFFVLYKVLIKQKEFWLKLLFACITVVNFGYFMLSLAKTVEFAIFANDVAYFGSVFLSMCMLFTILKLCGFAVNKRMATTLIILGCIMFFIVATSGFLPWYYKSVSIQTINGATKLVKEYGVLHNTYLVYLSLYFVAMIGAIVHSALKKKSQTQKIAGLLSVIVFINLAVWFAEKFGKWHFEFLSVSYLVSELMFILLYWLIQDYILIKDVPKYTTQQVSQLGVAINSMPMDAKLSKVLRGGGDDSSLTAREQEILELILQNKKRKDIATELMLSENTVKTYTRTLYAKLGVTSRAELFDMILKN